MTKFIHRTAFLFLCFALLSGAAVAQSTAFTYQGKLSVSGAAANGNFDMRFTLEDVDEFELSKPVTIPNVIVTQGIFTVQLDFGTTYFDQNDRYLKIEVRPSGQNPPDFTLLSPRQKITPAPASLFARTSSFSIFAGTSALAQDAQKLGGIFPSGFIQNTTTQQTADFNVSGNGVIGGNLAVGAGTPTSKLEVFAQDGLAITGFQPFLTLRDTAGANRRGFIQSANGDLLFIPESFHNLNSSAVTIKDNTGNVGIGTTAPGSKLSVAGNVSTSGSLTVGSGASISNGLSVNSGNLSVAGNATVGSLNSGSVAATGNLTVGGDAIVSNGLTVNSGNLSVANGQLAVFGFSNLSTVSINFAGTGGDDDVCRNSGNRALVRCSSSLRYKSQVESFGGGLNIVNRLRPISFIWNHSGQPDIGFGAEEVFRIEPLLATFNDAGEIEGVKYKQFSVVLVNAVKEQQAQIERQQKQVDALTRFICSQNPQAEICQGE